METTFSQEINKSLEILSKMKTVSILLEIKKEIEENKLCVDCNSTEYSYIETNAIVKNTDCILELISNKISELSKTKE